MDIGGIKEECGVVGLFINSNSKTKEKITISEMIYNGLISIQHRGQDSCGFVVKNKSKEMIRKIGLGLVSEVFKKEDLTIDGDIAIGHTRYPTTGRCKIEDVQPIVYKNISLAHNGHISNYFDLRKEYEKIGYSFVGTVDSEPLLYIIDYELKNGKNIEEAIKKIMKKVVGSYSVVAIIDGNLVIFRDPHSIRPLVYGSDKNGNYCFGSESVVLDINGFEYGGSVDGGEVIIVNGKNENKIIKKTLLKKSRKNCMFEYVYFSRPDSIINNLSVNKIRKKLGEELAKEHPTDADVVVPVPDTSRTAALSYAKKEGIPYEEGLIKNRYIGRTFIMNNQEKRKNAVRRKLNPIKEVINEKRVVLIDDSIVRGTTMKEIVKMVRKEGAKEIHLRITSPPIISPCFYGVDMPTYNELLANKKNINEIKEYLDVDSLGYLSINGLKNVLGEHICTGCINGEYFSDYVDSLAKQEKDKEENINKC